MWCITSWWMGQDLEKANYKIIQIKLSLTTGLKISSRSIPSLWDFPSTTRWALCLWKEPSKFVLSQKLYKEQMGKAWDEYFVFGLNILLRVVRLIFKVEEFREGSRSREADPKVQLKGPNWFGLQLTSWLRQTSPELGEKLCDLN